jgi:hypothetical protein
MKGLRDRERRKTMKGLSERDKWKRRMTGIEIERKEK